jgi:hypothetical protein
MEGLARLLVLEKLADDGMRTAFLEGRRNLRGRPDQNSRYNKRNKRKYKGDLKEETGMGIEMNDYDVASLHIPYGPGWDARRIDKLVYQTVSAGLFLSCLLLCSKLYYQDLGMNCEYLICSICLF